MHGARLAFLLGVYDENTELFGYYNNKGQLVIPCEYNYADGFRGGKALTLKLKGDKLTKASQIAAVSQFVMRPGWENARGVWADALFDSFRTATDDTVRMAYLEQLRWCGNKKHALAIQVVASTSPSRAVRDFANVVVRELSR